MECQRPIRFIDAYDGWQFEFNRCGDCVQNAVTQASSRVKARKAEIDKKREIISKLYRGPS